MAELALYAPGILVLAALVGLGAGFVKGAVGFAMPMILISGLGSLLPPETALGALILPTVVSNLYQALRDGVRAALATARRFRVYLLIVLIFIAFSAQLVRWMPEWVFYLSLGVPVTVFSVLQLLGWRPSIKPHQRRRAEIGIGATAGFIGGISGVWGPPTVMYLTAIETPKAEQMRAQGVVYGAGAVVLLVSHAGSGILNSHTLPLSVAMLAPCILGLWLGYWANARMDQARFRQATLAVLIVAGLNLLRKGIAAL